MLRIVRSTGTSQGWYQEYATIAAALDAAADGDSIYIPAGIYIVPSNGYDITKSLTIYGDGMGNAGDTDGTVLVPATPAGHPYGDYVFNIVAPANGTLESVTIRDLKIKPVNGPAAKGTRPAINCVTTAPANPSDISKVVYITLERVRVLEHGHDAFHIEGANGGNAAIVGLRIVSCIASFGRSNGIYAKFVTGASIEDSTFDANWEAGAFLEAVEARLYNTSFENNQNRTTTSGVNADYDVQLRLKSCHNFVLLGCHFERFTTNSILRTAVCVENCYGGNLLGTFVGDDAVHTGTRGILIRSTSSAIIVGAGSWNYIDTLIEIKAADNNTNCIVMPQSIRNIGTASCSILVPDEDDKGNVAFWPTRFTSNVAAGLVLPRVTGTVRDAIDSKHAGMILYNSSSKMLNLYNGSEWRPLVRTTSAIDLTQQTGDIALTTLLASAPAGLYRVSVVVVCTWEGITGTLDVTLYWADDNSPTQFLVVVDDFDLTVAGYVEKTVLLQVASGYDVKYKADRLNVQGAPKYSLYLRMENLQ